ncbi:hypothetical protein [Enterovibrio paralichthyis]|uniref:hypothetical protein n=1 Tax=Enterovibrio paralichthyis TaxID=2853805 RepID=UPI001C48783E|nr:hypothetical protein [Enterovibrio paralichthyis]MBV7300255.1 hypothetical protein [Enterovibrio paralichthyis]
MLVCQLLQDAEIHYQKLEAVKAITKLVSDNHNGMLDFREISRFPMVTLENELRWYRLHQISELAALPDGWHLDFRWPDTRTVITVSIERRNGKIALVNLLGELVYSDNPLKKHKQKPFVRTCAKIKNPA